MKENTNEMILVFDSIPANEGLARVTAASFCTQLNPTIPYLFWFHRHLLFHQSQKLSLLPER